MSITGKTRDEEPDVADAPEMPDAVAPDAVPAETAPEEETRVQRPRWFRRAVAVALLLAVAGGVLQVLAWRARHDHPNTNRALTDTETTAVAIGDVSNGLSKIFSYAPDSTATTEQAAADVLGGAAASQYRTLFAQVKEHAAAERLTLTTHVVRAGVTRLSGHTAQLLVFLDQVIVRDDAPKTTRRTTRRTTPRATRKDAPKSTSAAAQLSVTARLESGHWRIVEIHAR